MSIEAERPGAPRSHGGPDVRERKLLGLEPAPKRGKTMPWKTFLKAHFGCAILNAAGVKCLKLPPRSPNLNSCAERFVLSIKKECLDKLVPLGERHLRLAISEFVAPYHLERNHQGLDNRLLTAVIAPANDADPAAPIERRRRLGGLLNHDCRPAA
jgi:transposase InsO family protein